MANQTVTTAVNYDDAAISGLLDGETLTLNGGAVTINSDVRRAQQAAVFGAVTISATLGGSLTIDGRDVWQVEFDAATGNVPALNALGSNTVTGGTSGATGELIRVYGSSGLTPLAAGGAIPSTGYLKLRTKTGNFVDNEVITLPGGATVTVNSATGGRRSWIEVVGREGTSITIPRLGSLIVRGDWYELGITSGAANQTFQCPVADSVPAIQIETGVGTGVYEWWLNGGDRWANATAMISQDARGKFFGINSATGVITIANTATGAACGLLPGAGRKVRIPNVFLCNAASTNYTVNTRNATLATRYDLTTTGGGFVDIDKATSLWYLSYVSAYAVTMTNSALSFFYCTNIATAPVMTDCAQSYSEGQSAGISFSGCFTGVTLLRSKFARYLTGSTSFSVQFNDCANVTVEDNESHNFGGSTTTITHGHANSYSFQFTRCNDVTFARNASIGARVAFTSCAGVACDDTRWADVSIGITTATTPYYAISADTFSSDVVISGFSNFEGLANVHPYNGIAQALNAVRVTIQNIGTPAANYPGGSSAAMRYVFNAGTTVGLTVKRVYVDDTGTGPFLLPNTVQNVTIENFWAGPLDAGNIAAINAVAKGCRMGAGTTPQASCYGTHWGDIFTGTTSGSIMLWMNEPLASTANQCAITSGTPKFTAAGTLAFDAIGDEVTWTCPWTIIGHTSLSNTAIITGGTNTTFVTMEFAVDTGSGYGAWLEATPANLSAQVIDSVAGFNFKFRIRRTSGAAQAVINYVRIVTDTNATAQQQQYPDGSVDVEGADPTDIVQLVKTGSIVVEERVGPGVIEYVSEPGVEAWIVRRTSTNVLLMQTRALPNGAIDLDPGYQGIIYTYAGSAVQVASVEDAATKVKALIPEVGLIPALL